MFPDPPCLPFFKNVLWTHSWWECVQPVFGFVGLSHVLTLFSGCTNKLSAVRRWGQKAGLWARLGGVWWIKERCGKGGISRRSSWDHHQEEKCQIYRIQCSPGKQGGFDALIQYRLSHTLTGKNGITNSRWMLLRFLPVLRKQADGFHTQAHSNLYSHTVPWKSVWNIWEAVGIIMQMHRNTHSHKFTHNIRLQDSENGKYFHPCLGLFFFFLNVFFTYQ